ncbi:MAG: hypothetical protein WC570_05425 [Patescibacteria group bacterium]
MGIIDKFWEGFDRGIKDTNESLQRSSGYYAKLKLIEEVKKAETREELDEIQKRLEKATDKKLD